jgi:hypothetical protein
MKYIIIDIIISIIIGTILFIISGIDDMVLGIVIILILKLSIVIFLSIVNFIWFKIVKIETYSNINMFLLIAPIIGPLLALFFSMSAPVDNNFNIENIVIILPISTIFLHSLYIRNHIIEKYENNWKRTNGI